VGRTVGKSLREFRRATSNLKAEFEQDVEPARTPPRRRRPPAVANGATNQADGPPPEETPERPADTGGSTE
jgi:Sec-independent protein translocase protein TatA